MLCGWKNSKNRRMLRVMFAFEFMMFGFYAIEHRFFGTRSGPGWYAVAIGFAMSVIGIMWTFGFMAYRQHDEFHKALLTQATVWSGVVTMTCALIWGFLETSGKVAVVPLIAVPVAFVMLLALIFAGLRLRHRPVDE